MGVFGALAGLGAGVLGGIAAGVASFVGGIVGVVAGALSAVVASVGGVLSGIGTIIGGALAGVGTLVSGITSAISSAVTAISNISFTKLSGWTSALKKGFTGFLEAIHFDTLMKVHDIAYLVSSSYRKQMMKVWLKISEFAAAAELPAGYIENAINTARAIVLEVSGAMGKSYDLAEITWLSSLKDLMEKINETAEKYRRNPQQIWLDLNELIVKPAIDTRSEFERGLLVTIDKVISTGKDLAEWVEINSDKIENVLDVLPDKIKEKVEPYITDVLADIDRFRNNIFEPTVGRIEKIIDVVYSRQGKNIQRLQDLGHLIALPGDLLSGVDRLADWKRVEQENKIGEVSNRAARRQDTDWADVVEDKKITLEAVRKALEYKAPPPFWFVPEVPGIMYPVGKPPEPGKTWFVGDY